MDNREKTWKILDIIKVSEKALNEKNIENARLNAELLLSDTLNTDRINLYLNFDKPLSPQELSSFKSKLTRRLHCEPLQYILGYTEFFGSKFIVRPGVLIPRQETELLVDKAIEIIKDSGIKKPKVLEIGTGSGCISISLAKNCECSLDAIDISNEAITVAKENSEILGTSAEINFYVKDFFDFNDLSMFDLVISNPPYVPLCEFINLPREIREYEPRNALTDENDGLVFYRKLLSLIKNQNILYPFLLEICDGKSDKIKEILIENGLKNFRIFEDYMGIERMLVINYTK